MQIKVGGKYRARNGQTTEIISEIISENGCSFRGRTSVGDRWNYESNGNWAGGLGRSEHDLLEEIVVFQVASYYRTRDGQKAFVAAVTSNPFRPDGPLFRGYTNVGGSCSWSLSGVALDYAGGGPEPPSIRQLDLIAPWAEPVLVKLNDQHTAEISDVVKVGCQEFPVEKIAELAAALEKYRSQLPA